MATIPRMYVGGRDEGQDLVDPVLRARLAHGLDPQIAAASLLITPAVPAGWGANPRIGLTSPARGDELIERARIWRSPVPGPAAYAPLLQPMRVLTMWRRISEENFPPLQAIAFGPAKQIDYGTRFGAARGLWRVFNAAVYRFYRSTVAPPVEGDVPFATSATLPNQPASVFADGVWYLSVSRFNGVLDSGFYPIGPRGETYIRLEIAAATAVSTRPSVPMGAQLEVRPGGVIRVIAYYLLLSDAGSAADSWGLAYTTNGTTPASGAASITQAMTSGPFQILSYDLPAQANGTVVKVQLQTLHGAMYSLPSTVLTATAVAAGPTAPLGLGSWAGALPPSEDN